MIIIGNKNHNGKFVIILLLLLLLLFNYLYRLMNVDEKLNNMPISLFINSINIIKF